MRPCFRENDTASNAFHCGQDYRGECLVGTMLSKAHESIREIYPYGTDRDPTLRQAACQFPRGVTLPARGYHARSAMAAEWTLSALGNRYVLRCHPSAVAARRIPICAGIRGRLAVCTTGVSHAARQIEAAEVQFAATQRNGFAPLRQPPDACFKNGRFSHPCRKAHGNDEARIRLWDSGARPLLATSTPQTSASPPRCPSRHGQRC